MTGPQMINMFGMLIGMHLISDDTTPTDDQALLLINASKNLIVAQYGAAMPELHKSADPASGISDFVTPLAMAPSPSTGNAAEFLSREEFLRRQSATEFSAEKPIWTFQPKSSPDGKVYTEILPDDIGELFEYVRSADDYTDTGSPTVAVPLRFELLILRHAAALYKLGNDRANEAALLLGSGRQQGGK